MRMFRKLMLAAGVAAVPLAFAAGANAAPPDRGVVLYNAEGVPVAILTPLQPPSRPIVAAPAAEDPALRMIRALARTGAADDDFFPFAQIMAQQDHMLHEVMAEMRGMTEGAGPFGATDAALPAGPGAQRIVISSFSSDRGSCSQTITYRYAGDAARPVVTVRNVGDACGPADAPTTRSVPAAVERSAPMAEPPQVPAESPAVRTYRIDYRTPAGHAAPKDLRG